MKSVALYDIDSKIPNLALMKLSAYYKNRGYRIIFSKNIDYIKADKYFASTIFHRKKSKDKVITLKTLYGDNIDIGGSGINLQKKLPPEIDVCFPDYTLYNHHKYALGFITRGCKKRCPFCLVPLKEGRVQKRYATFDDFVPKNQNNIMLLDDNLLSFPDAEAILSEIIDKNYHVNFSQTLDIAYLNANNYKLLKKVKSKNARFTRDMFYFSCNEVSTIKIFMNKKDLLKGFGKDAVTVVTMYSYNTYLSDDY